MRPQDIAMEQWQERLGMGPGAVLVNMHLLPPPPHPSSTPCCDHSSGVIGNGGYCLRVAQCRQGGYVAGRAGTTGGGAADRDPSQSLPRSRL